MNIFSHKIEATLKQMEEYERSYASVFAVDGATGELLYKKVLEIKPKSVLELGTWRGASAIYLAAALQVLGEGKVITLDKSLANIEKAKANIAAAGLDAFVECRLQDADKFLRKEKNLFGFVFIDAAKAEYGKWVEAIFSAHLAPEGIVILDDVSTMSEKMADLFSVLSKHPEIKATHHAIGNGLLELRRD